MAEGLVGGHGYASTQASSAQKPTASASRPARKGGCRRICQAAIDEYLATLDDAAFGAATQIAQSRISPADPTRATPRRTAVGRSSATPPIILSTSRTPSLSMSKRARLSATRRSRRQSA